MCTLSCECKFAIIYIDVYFIMWMQICQHLCWCVLQHVNANLPTFILMCTSSCECKFANIYIDVYFIMCMQICQHLYWCVLHHVNAKLSTYLLMWTSSCECKFANIYIDVYFIMWMQICQNLCWCVLHHMYANLPTFISMCTSPCECMGVHLKIMRIAPFNIKFFDSWLILISNSFGCKVLFSAITLFWWCKSGCRSAHDTLICRHTFSVPTVVDQILTQKKFYRIFAN